MCTTQEWVHSIARLTISCGIITLIYVWKRKRSAKPALSRLSVLVIALLGLVFGLIRTFVWQRTYDLPLICLCLGIFVALAISDWITSIRMRRRIRSDLGRQGTDADLTSIRTWMEVVDTEQRNEKNKPLG